MRDDALLDHLVRAQQQRGRDAQTERLRGPHIDDELELRRLLDGEIRGLRPRMPAMEAAMKQHRSTRGRYGSGAGGVKDMPA